MSLITFLGRLLYRGYERYLGQGYTFRVNQNHKSPKPLIDTTPPYLHPRSRFRSFVLFYKKSLKPSLLQRYHRTWLHIPQISVFILSITPHPFLTTIRKTSQIAKVGTIYGNFSDFHPFTHSTQTPFSQKIPSKPNTWLRIKWPSQNPRTPTFHILPTCSIYNKHTHSHFLKSIIISIANSVTFLLYLYIYIYVNILYYFLL